MFLNESTIRIMGKIDTRDWNRYIDNMSDRIKEVKERKVLVTGY